MLAGAFFGFLGTYLSGSFLVGVIFAVVAGAIFAAAMAFLSIRLRADQIVVGIGINILALGLTSFVFREVFSGPQVLLDRPAPWKWPLLSRIPGVGEALFAQPGWVYMSLVVVVVVWFVLQRTTWGLSMRATGELAGSGRHGRLQRLPQPLGCHLGGGWGWPAPAVRSCR